MLSPQFLLLDEPAAGMSVEESSDLATLIRRIVAEYGCGVLLIEHNIGLVLTLCEQIYVLDSGQVIESGAPDVIKASEVVRHAYMGTQAEPVEALGVTLLSVDRVTVNYGQLTALRDVSLRLEAGQTLFVAGPNGAGKSTLLKAIAGTVKPRHGQGDVRRRAHRRPLAGGYRAARPFHGPGGRDVFTSLTVDENLRVGAGMRADRDQAARDLEEVYATFPMLRERKATPAGCSPAASSRCSSSVAR